MSLHPVQTHRLAIDEYLAPDSIDGALAALAVAGGRARLIAGGTDLLLEMARGQRPGVGTVIDVSRVEGLDSIERQGEDLVLGPMVTHNQAATSVLVQEHALPLAQACREVASPQLRNRATVVGNLVTASPANDTITPLRALGTVLTVASVRGTREIELGRFYRGVRETDLAADEMVTGVRVRMMKPGQRALFVKLGLRRAQAVSVVNLALLLAFDGPTVASATVTLGSVAPTIVNAEAAEAFLAGKPLTPDVVAQAARMIGSGATPIDDIRSSAWYRSEQVRVLAERALTTVAQGREREMWSVDAITLADDRPVRPSRGYRAKAGQDISAVVNGKVLVAPAGTGSLLDWLRDGVGLTGSKEGCAEGECGACTVILDGRAVMACLVPAGRAEGAEVLTVEGLASESLLQRAFIDQGAVQCGYCIPGFVVAGAKLLQERPRPSPADIRTAFSGNLCRCTGYFKIIAAVEQAARGAP